MTTIAFIGLGHMGGGMAANLAKAGHDVRAFDLSSDALDKAKAAGCLPVDSAGAAVGDADAVVTMLPNGAIVDDLYSDAWLATIKPGAVLIDCSTIDVATARSVAERAGARGLLAVDAPVSGGIAAAAAGTLTFMVGGTDAAFERARAVLDDMGHAVIHAGTSGSGQAAKICNNMILGATMIATCEAFALAAKLGLDPAKFFDIASVSSGQSWSMTKYCPVPGVGPDTPADHGYEGGFATALMLKDLLLARDAAASVGASAPIGSAAADIYQRFADAGGGTKDFSAVITTLS